MPFEPLSPEEQKLFAPPCSSSQHNPPSNILLFYPCKWVCPACGASMIIYPSVVSRVGTILDSDPEPDLVSGAKSDQCTFISDYHSMMNAWNIKLHSNPELRNLLKYQV